MELRDIEIFLVSAGSGSFSRAAAQLYLNHATVSRAVARLEHELGVSLFSRDSRGVELTSAGRELLEGGTALLAAEETLRQKITCKGDKICKETENLSK
ncbi:MAG: LysR family transcriptional regulator [Oscillospiraceae bacterium]